MPKRRIDPATGEPELTYREQQLIDEYMRNGGKGAQAALAAGYTAVRPDQAAYQVLHRQRVQQHIRERIRESRVSADEIIGTVASHMRGDLTEFFDESGNFSIQVARDKGIGHLLKSISGTICDNPEPTADQTHLPGPHDQPLTDDNVGSSQRSNVPTCERCNAQGPSKRANVPRTFRAQLHSPLQAASILARLIGPGLSYPRNKPATRNLQLATSRDFDPNALLQSLIEEQMREHGLSRDAVTNRILQLRPEFAKYLDELPSPSALDELRLRDTTKLLADSLDAIASLRRAISPPDSPKPVGNQIHAESCGREVSDSPNHVDLPDRFADSHQPIDSAQISIEHHPNTAGGNARMIKPSLPPPADRPRKIPRVATRGSLSSAYDHPSMADSALPASLDPEPPGGSDDLSHPAPEIKPPTQPSHNSAETPSANLQPA